MKKSNVCLRVLTWMLVCSLSLAAVPVGAADRMTEIGKTGYDIDAVLETDPTAGGYCGVDGGEDLYWLYFADYGLLYIGGWGSMGDYTEASPAPYLSRKSGITGLYVDEGVNCIGKYAFAGLDRLTSVVLPSSLYLIDDYAFSGTALTDLLLPDALEYIGKYAFKDCTGLAKVTIPGSVIYVRNYAFDGCSRLAISCEAASPMPGWATRWSSGAGSVSWRTRTSTGLSYASAGTNTVYIAGIGSCSDKNVVIPAVTASGKTVVGIGEGAFSGCGDVVSVHIPDTVTYIDDGAFAGSGINHIDLPASVTRIGEDVFEDCFRISAIRVDGANTAYVSVDDCLIDTASHTLLRGCGTSRIPGDGSVTSIAPYAFEHSTMTSIVIPASVSSIGKFAFYGCEDLTSVTFSEGLRDIGMCAFMECPSLARAAIPNGVENVGGAAFMNCTSLEAVSIPASVTYIGENAFTGTNAPLSVYTGSTSIPSGWDKNWCPSGSTVTRGCAMYGSKGLAYRSNGDGTCVVSGIGTCTDSDIEIPFISPTCERVTGIADGAFRGNKSITGVVIDQGVTSIGSNAFNGCTQLTSVLIPDSVETVGDNAFFGDTRAEIDCVAASRPAGWSSTWNFSGGKEKWDCLATDIYTLSGTLTAVGGTGIIVYVLLYDEDDAIVKNTFTLPDKDGKASYAMDRLTPGRYTLAAYGEGSGKTLVRHVYEVIVTGDAEVQTQDIELHLLGDVDGNGYVRTSDVAIANAYVCGYLELDEYQQCCADVLNDGAPFGTVTTADVAKLNSAVRGITKLTR